MTLDLGSLNMLSVEGGGRFLCGVAFSSYE
jgi:hypothetical protein